MLDPGLDSPQQEHPFLFHNSNTRHENCNRNRAQNRCNDSYDQDHDQNYYYSNSSGVSSPPLWRTSPSRTQQQQQKQNYRSLSPASRAQAIARGQKELMDMVRSMPESCYELSLKDLVEVHHHPMPETNINNINASLSLLDQRSDSKKRVDDTYPMMIRRKRSGRQVEEKGSSSSGFLLKMVFPVSLGSKTKSKTKMTMKKKVVVVKNKSEQLANNDNCNMSAKVSPKPSNLVSENGGSSRNNNSTTGVDKEWWKKRMYGEREGSSGSDRYSSNSGSMKSTTSGGSRSSSLSSSGSSSIKQVSGSGSRGRGRGGCWWFIIGKKKGKEE